MQLRYIRDGELPIPSRLAILIIQESSLIFLANEDKSIIVIEAIRHYEGMSDEYAVVGIRHQNGNVLQVDS